MSSLLIAHCPLAFSDEAEHSLHDDYLRLTKSFKRLLELFFMSLAVHTATALVARDDLAPIYGDHDTSAMEGEYIVAFNKGYILE